MKAATRSRNSEQLYPWPLGILVYRREINTDWHLSMAFTALTITPAAIVFFAAQKHNIAGLTAGAVEQYAILY